MSWFSSKPPEKSVDTRTIADALARGAAEAIDARYGETGNHLVSESDVAQARAEVRSNRPELEQSLGALQTKIIERNLDVLEAMVQGKAKGPEAFCSCMTIFSIRDPAVQRCAEVITSNFRPGVQADDPARPETAYLTLDKLVWARKVYAQLQSGELERTNPELAQRLRAEPHFNEPNIDALELFMREGRGGIVDHGPMSVPLDKDGKVVTFEHVFKLPVPFAGDGEDLEARLKKYEDEFSHTGYDRVYLTSEEGEGFYVAIIDQGFLPQSVRAGTRVQQGTPDEPGGLFRVLAARDVDNTVAEAAARPLMTAARTAKNSLAQLFSDRFAAGMRGALETIPVNDPKQVERYEQRRLRELKEDGLNVTKIALTGAAAVGWPTALAIGLGGLTGMNVVDYATGTKSARQFFGAVGVMVQRTGPVVP
ncbi:MAG: hypothetical protein AAB426_00630 [Myxococcota bacterium]